MLQKRANQGKGKGKHLSSARRMTAAPSLSMYASAMVMLSTPGSEKRETREGLTWNSPGKRPPTSHAPRAMARGRLQQKATPPLLPPPGAVAAGRSETRPW